MNWKRRQPATEATTLRIIGGTLRGRRIAYTGEIRTRPMKERVREAVFNLVGPGIRGKHAIDLFAGTGALGLEALSRGASRATFIERHFPSSRLIRQNAEELGVAERCEIVAGDTFLWARQLADVARQSAAAWAVFCSPPFDFYVDRWQDLDLLCLRVAEHAPAGSLLVVESDLRFDASQLPPSLTWDTRQYPPAQVSLAEIDSKSSAAEPAKGPS